MSFYRIRSKNKSRYGEKRGYESNGYKFMSKLEAAVYQVLLLREKAGELNILQTQDHVYLTEARIGCVPDFKCMDVKTGEMFWVEAKGFANDRWPIIKKLWAVYGPGKMEVWKGTYTKPFLDETIIPKGDVK